MVITRQSISVYAWSSQPTRLNILNTTNPHEYDNIGHGTYTSGWAKQNAMSGGRKPRYSDREILTYIYKHDDPFVATGEIRDEFDYNTTSGANSRMNKLKNEGFVDTKMAGPAAGWWLTEKGIKYVEETTSNSRVH